MYIQEINHKKFNFYIEHLVLIGLFGTLILPSVNLGISINAITIISIILILLMPILIKNKQIKINRFILYYFLILLSIFYSINNSYIFLDVETNYRDYMEWFRYIQVVPYLLVASMINYDSFEKKFNQYLKISVIYIIFIAFLQITNILNIGYYTGLLYSSVLHAEGMYDNSQRIILTGSNPSVGGLIVLFLIILTFLSNKNNFFKNIQLPFLILILLMTQSRTVFIGFIFSLFVYMLVFLKINFLLKLCIILFIGYTVYEILLFLNFEYILIGFQMAMEGTNNSLNTRFENLLLAYDRFLESIALGWGPAKSIHDTVIDSEYALILQRYGLAGIFLFLGYLLLIIQFSFKLYKIKYVTSINMPLVGFLITIVGSIVMIANNFFIGYQAVAIPTLVVVSLIAYRKQLTKTY